MKQIFNWLREQIQSKANLYRECPSESCWIRSSKNCDKCGLKSLEVREILDVINEAEAKWEADCCEWYERDFEDSFYYSHSGKELDYKNDVKCWNFCPYCGKPIKISEVE